MDECYAYYYECPICGKEGEVALTEEEVEALADWEMGELPIQDALPNRTKEEREAIKTHLCPDCQGELFA